MSLSRLIRLPPGDPIIRAELKQIQDNLEAELALGQTSYLDCFKYSHNKIALRTVTGILIQA